MAVWRYFLEGFCDDLVEGLLRSRFVGLEQLFELGPGLFDGVQVR